MSGHKYRKSFLKLFCFHSLFVGGTSSFIVVTNSRCGTGSASGAGEGFSGMKEGGTSGGGAGCLAGAGL